MMLPPIPLELSAEITAALLLAGALALRVALPDLAAMRRTKLAYAAVAGALAAMHAAWAVGLACYPLCHWGAALATLSIPVLALVVPSLGVAGLVRLAARRALRVPQSPVPVDGGRRTFLAAATALAPAAALGGGVMALAGGQRSPSLRTVRFAWPDLPARHSGLRILQLSDLHLGCGRSLAHLEAALDAASRHRPDLVVLTGDIAEDPELLGPALAMVGGLRPRLGAFACLGNHEYLRDIRRSRPCFERSDVELLVDGRARVVHGGAPLEILGIDDPITTGGDIRPFLRERLDRALDGSDSGATRILLSHRPEAFDAASRQGVHLVLSGHTHGGQIGLNGRSAFEPLYRDGYLWGPYARGASRLYTTSGFGNWYPVRLGCPSELPLVELVRAPAGGA